MRILIAGQPRSGTTALFLAHQAVMPPETLALFEPALPLDMELVADPLLVKTLIGSLPGEDLPQWQVEDFDECFVLVRDPRDRLISLLLFLPQWWNRHYPPLWQAQPAGLDRYRASVHQKVTAPASLPTWVLFERLMGLRFGLHRGEALSTLQHLQQVFLTFHAHALSYATTVFYEVLAQPIVGQIVQPPPRAYARILRRGTPGEWRQWFTPEDVDYFRPVFQPYLTWYGYEDDWKIPEAQVIRQATSTHYMDKWSRVDRRRGAHATPAP